MNKVNCSWHYIHQKTVDGLKHHVLIISWRIIIIIILLYTRRSKKMTEIVNNEVDVLIWKG